MSESPDRTAVLLDPHPIWLDAVTRVLERAHVTVVGTSTSIPDALALLDRHEPDLLVTETNVGGGLPEGLACIREARLRHPGLRVVALAAGDVDEALRLAQAARGHASRSGNEFNGLMAMLTEARILRRIGRADEAETRFGEAAAIAREGRAPSRLREVLREWADLRAETGDHRGAYELTSEALTVN